MDIRIFVTPNFRYYDKYKQDESKDILDALREEFDEFDEICWTYMRRIEMWWADETDNHWYEVIPEFSKRYPHFEFTIEVWDFGYYDDDGNYIDYEDKVNEVTYHNGKEIER